MNLLSIVKYNNTKIFNLDNITHMTDGINGAKLGVYLYHTSGQHTFIPDASAKDILNAILEQQTTHGQYALLEIKDKTSE